MTGAVLALSGALLADRIRSRRELLRDDRTVRRDCYVSFPVAIDRAYGRQRTLADPAAGRPLLEVKKSGKLPNRYMRDLSHWRLFASRLNSPLLAQPPSIASFLLAGSRGPLGLIWVFEDPSHPQGLAQPEKNEH